VVRDMSNEKDELRTLVRQRKAEMSSEERRQWSVEVCDKVMKTEKWLGASMVMLYWPLGDETDVRPLIGEALRQGKTVVLPTCMGDELVLRIYEGEEKMSRGAFGIMEPQGRVIGPKEYGDIDLIVVPGVAFDNKGGRLGRGKGYYDRLLKQMTGCWKMGVCWRIQITDEVPTGPYDVRMDEVIS